MKPLPASKRRAPLAVDEVVENLIQSRGGPVTAYDLVRLLAQRGERVAPQQVYRSLGRLRDAGILRRIESLNAFCLGEEDSQAIIYCSTCGSYRLAMVVEFAEQLRKLARQAGFVVQRTIIELSGQCDRCANQQGKG